MGDTMHTHVPTRPYQIRTATQATHLRRSKVSVMDNAVARHKRVLGCSAIPAEVLTSILRLHMYAFQLQRLLSWGIAYLWQECLGCKHCALPPLVSGLHFSDCTPSAVKMAFAEPCSVKRKITARENSPCSDHFFVCTYFLHDLCNLITGNCIFSISNRCTFWRPHSPTCIDSMSLFVTRTNDVD